MCFSATASFAASAVTGAAGLYAATRVTRANETLLAAIPFTFSLQQGIEGLLWLTLQHRMPAHFEPLLVNAFIVCALIAWPLVVPSAARLVETDQRRFLPMTILIALGVIAASYAAVDTLHHPYFVRQTVRSLCYINNSPYPIPIAAAYVLAICGSMLLSSHRELRTLGMLITSGLIVSLTLYFTVFLSVWCFFAAAASVVVCTFFTGEAHTRVKAAS